MAATLTDTGGTPGGGVNPISFGSGTSTETSSGLNHTHIPAVFNRNFLKHAVDNLVLADIAEKFDLPQHAGTQTMRFFRRSEANVDNVRSLTEGTPLTTHTLATINKVEVSLSQYGDLTKITDTRLLTDLIRQLELETARMGEEAALHLDTLIRDTAYTAYDVSGQTGQQVNVAAGSDLVARHLDQAATILHENRAPTFEGGHYIGVLSPRQAYDIRGDANWLDIGKYQSGEKIYRGEIGKLFNVKVVVATNPKEVTDPDFDYDVIVDAGETGTFEVGWVFGKECIGTIKMAGTPGPMAPQLVINNKADKTDPLNQYAMVGWKAYAAKVLNEKFGVMIRSQKATF